MAGLKAGFNFFLRAGLIFGRNEHKMLGQSDDAV